MKFLHTSDWHLGIDLHKQSLIEDQKVMIDEICTIILEEQIDVVLISGDIYDTTLASKEAIHLFDYAMKRICQELHCQCVVIAGNHDSQTRLSVMKDLLASSGLYIYGTLDEKPTPLIINDVDIFPIPYLHKDRIAALYDQSLISYEHAFLTLMDDIRSQKKEHKQFVLAHAFVSGASISESDRFAMVGGSDLVSKDVFHDLDYVALGHLHKPQCFDEHIRYSGSPLAYAFSEQDQKHVVIIDSDTMDITTRSLTPLHPLITLTGAYDDIIKQLPLNEEAYVKIVLKDLSVSYELLGFLRERCPHLLALTGIQPKELMETMSLQVEQLDEYQDENILVQFFKDYYDREISEEELAWFEEARKGEPVCV